MLIKSSDLASSYVHGSQEKIRQLFDQAEQNAPIVVCFDEFDALVPDRSWNNVSSEEVNEFLSQMNNCSKRGIFIVATSNRPDKIDPAVLRTGRIDKMVYVPLPDYEARKEMFALYLKDRPKEDGIDVEELASMTEGYIASDIAYIVNDAAMVAAYTRTKISKEVLLSSVTATRPSVRSESIKQYDDIRRKMEDKNRRNVTDRSVVRPW
jgi:transitional endoplasmic reticulum ATPase